MIKRLLIKILSRKWYVRLYVVYHVLFGKWKNYFIFHHSEQELLKIMAKDYYHEQDEPIVHEFSYWGLDEYHIWLIMKQILESKSDIDLTLNKAEYWAKVEEYVKQKEQKAQE